jgi:hypothetical protein
VHAQIKACDAVLEGMETVLSGFQKNLGSISNAIRHLQDEVNCVCCSYLTAIFNDFWSKRGNLAIRIFLLFVWADVYSGKGEF